MTKELSKQICEKCTIAPQYIYIVKGLITELELNKDELIAWFDDRDTISTFKVVKVIKIYPDFGQPENFVKLMELPIRERTLIEIITTTYSIVNVKHFLEAIDEYLTVGKYGLRIRKAIREAEWKYE